jgi:hypothetical protein
MRTLLRQQQRIVTPRQPLVRIAQGPQRPGGNALTDHTRVVPIEERQGTVLLGIISSTCYIRGGMCYQ